MNPRVLVMLRASALLVAGALAACSRPDAQVTGTWNRTAAAAYLDRRADWWMGWQGAARDHQTFCVSCHTALPFALSRAALREPLAADDRSNSELRLLENVAKRVRLWKTVGPYYGDHGSDPQKAFESRGTEAVLNALILAYRDSWKGRLGDDTRAAFDNM